MKKYCFLLLLAATFSTPIAFAQQAPDLRTQATDATRKLAQQISLDDARTPKVKKLTYERLVQENELKQMYSIDPAMLQSKMAVVEKEYAEKLKEVLTEAQYQRYVASTTIVPAPVTAAPAMIGQVLPATTVTQQPTAAQPAAPTQDKAPVTAKKPTAATQVNNTAATKAQH